MLSMHLIINGKNGGNSIGAKAENLISIDSLGLAPDFVAVSYEFLSDEFGAGPFSSGRKLSPLFTKKIEDSIKFLGQGPLIVRSSCSCEDKGELSYAGMFISKVCVDRSKLFSHIKEVWNSCFLGRILSYEKISGAKIVPKMGVIIQKYVKADYGGVIFHNHSEDWYYLESARGDVSKVVSGEVKPLCCLCYSSKTFMSSLTGIGYENILDEVAVYAKKLSAFVAFKDFDIEFAFSGGKYYFLQIRPLTAKVNPFAINYAFPFITERDNFAHGDEDIAFMNNVLSNFNLHVPNFIDDGSCLVISGTDLKKLMDSIKRAVFVRGMAQKFKIYFFDMLANERVNYSSIVLQNVQKLFCKLKNFNFRFSFMDWLHVSLQKEIEECLKLKYGNKVFFEMLPEFTPNHLFTEQKLSDNFGGQATKKQYESMSADIANARKVFSGIKSDSLKKEKYNAVEIENLSILLELRDRIDYHYTSVSMVYHKAISCICKYKGNISELCRLSFSEVESVLLGREIHEHKPKKTKIKREFPLSGLIASEGSVEGRAIVIKKLDDMHKVNEGDILIAKYTRPDLMIAMAKAGGIVTENGGITSHAAIVSRELKIPCLVGCWGCTDIVHDGDIVKIEDGLLKLISRG